MEPGRVVADRFVIERLAGSGGMGSVYLATDRLGGPVALKTLSPHADTTRFAREIEMLAALEHPAIVRFVAHGVVDGAPFLAMEWLEGEDLGARLQRGPLSVRDALAIAVRIGEALSCAHARGVVHRDVKPSNVFLPAGGADDARLLDFGIARSGAAVELTRTGALVGTPGYMAPEQARGDRALDPRVDVFALGCVLFECLTGRPAFAGPNVMAVLARTLLEEAPRVFDLRSDVPAVLDDLVARMLAKEPSERPADGEAIVRALAGLSPTVAPVAAPRPSAVGTAEQRFVTVVLAGAASRSAVAALETLAANDPTPTLDRVRAELAPLGARVAAMLDGSIVCVLSGLASAMDQATHAARAALRVRAARPEIPIAVASGRALLTGHVPLGEAIDRAAGMVAPPSGAACAIRLDELTAGLLGPDFVVGGDARGLVLVDEHEADDVPRTLLGRPTPCVGRDKELAYLRGLFAESVEESASRAVLVTAPAGTGKSRLRQEITPTLAEEAEVWTARGDPLAAGSPLGLLARLLRRAFGLFDGEPHDVQARKVRARVARNVPSDQLARVAAFVGETIGVRLSDDELPALRAARADPFLMGDSTRAAFVDLLLHEASARPLALVLEDVHWSDRASLDYVHAARRRLADAPLFVLAFARPEVHRTFPGSWDDVQEIKLGGIGPRAAERLARVVLGDGASDAAVRQLAERAGGNAFYLEELIRAQAGGVTDALPATVVAMAQSRFDAFDSEDRRLLRAASVVGEVFWRGALGALLGEPPGRALDARVDALVAREMLSRHASARFVGETELAFRHALVREAAYAALTDDDRALGHRLAAAWLEAAGERDPMTLAEHHERGGAPQRASEWYRRAAEQALERNDFEAAMARADRSASCGASGETLGAVRLVQSIVNDWRGENALAAQNGREALALCPRASAHWHRAGASVAVACRRMGDRDGLAQVGREMLSLGELAPPGGVEVGCAARTALQLSVTGQAELARSLLDRIGRFADVLATEPVAWAWTRAAEAMTLLIAGDATAMLAHGAAIIDAAEAGGDLRTACNMRFYVGVAAQMVGDFLYSERLLVEAVELAERLGLWTLRMISQKDLAATLLALGRPEEARDLVVTALEAARAQHDRFQETTAYEILASALAALGVFDEAERAARTAVAMSDAAPPFRSGALGTLSRILLATGRTDEALAVAEQAIPISAGPGGVGATLARIEALLALGREREAREEAVLAHRRLLAVAAQQSASQWSAMFVAPPSAPPGPTPTLRASGPSRWRDGFLAMPDHRRIAQIAAAD